MSSSPFRLSSPSRRQATPSISPAPRDAAWVDVATDLWGRKENLRITLPEGFRISSLATLDAFFRIVEDVFGPEQRRLAPRSLPVQVRRLPFVIDSARILVPSSTSSAGSVAWAPLTDVSQLSRGSQLFVFQVPSECHSEASEPIPVARRVALRQPIRGDGNGRTRSSADHARSPGSPRSPPPPLPPASPRPPSVNRAPSPAAAAPLWDETDRVFLYLATKRLEIPGGKPMALSRLVADTALLSRLLQEVGVNLTQWGDREFLALRDPVYCAKEKLRMSYEEFIGFSHKYRSLVKLVYRHLSAGEKGSGKQNDCRDSFSPKRRPTAEAQRERKGDNVQRHPNRSNERRESSATRNEMVSTAVVSLKELSPPRNSNKSPARLQQSRCDRLSCGLSSVSTAKDRKMNLYDPL